MLKRIASRARYPNLGEKGLVRWIAIQQKPMEITFAYDKLHLNKIIGFLFHNNCFLILDASRLCV